MRKPKLWVLLSLIQLLVFSACTHDPQVSTDAPQPEIEFLADGTASLSVPSLNGNHVAIRITKPDGDGPFPVLIGVAGGDGMYVFRSGLQSKLIERGIVTVDFAPQGRDESEGSDNYNGYIHQDDLKAIVDFVRELPFVQDNDIGILSYSYGVVMATGALARYPDMPVAFLIDWEGPSSPGKDIQRGLENDEAWVLETLRHFNYGRDMTPEEISSFKIHGGLIYDDEYWAERDASLFAADISCPYLRVQFEQDHVQGTYKDHMMNIVNAATSESGQWTRVNNNPANIIYTGDDLSNYYFHDYLYDEYPGPNSLYSTSVVTVLFDYIEEMFFLKPYLEE
jgi:hypothetical protein